MSGPPPPSDLAGRRPSITRLRVGTVIHRFYSSKHHPIFFDRGRGGRLNARDGSYGVLYAAKKPAGAFAETFLRNPGSTQLPLDLLGRKAYVRLKVTGSLSLLQLAGPGLAHVGRLPRSHIPACPTMFRNHGRLQSIRWLRILMASPIMLATTTTRFATRFSTVQRIAWSRRAERSIWTTIGFGK